MNIGNWLKYEEVDDVDSIMQYNNPYRAAFEERRKGIVESSRATTKRILDTNTYLNSVGKNSPIPYVVR